MSEDERSILHNEPFSDEIFRSYVNFYTMLDEDERALLEDFFDETPLFH